MIPHTVVPCNGCTACCWGQAIFLTAVDDPPETYEVVPATNPATGRVEWMLAHSEFGACVYLGDRGCTIHNRAPAMCRAYDCRRQWKGLLRGERRRLERKGILDPALRAGRDRAHTLEE